MEIVKLQMCRICLVENVRMHEVASKILQELYEKLADVPFVTEDGRPMLACSFCYTKLKQCCQLQRKCLKAEELFTQMLNEDGETQPLLKQGMLKNFNEYIISPTVHISITDEYEELPDDCVAQDTDIPIKEEQRRESEDTNCFELEDIPLHSSDSENDVPLKKFKTEEEEDQAVSNKRQRVDTITRPPGSKTPELYVRLTKLEDTNTTQQTETKQLDSKITSVTKLKKSYNGPSSYNYKSSLISHVRVHNGACKCKICQKMYATNGQLRKHKRIHTAGASIFQCDLCQLSFMSKDSLIYHIRVHTGEKPFQCDICGYSFKIKSALKYHILRHSGEKPYKCEICERNFVSKWYLKNRPRACRATLTVGFRSFPDH